MAGNRSVDLTGRRFGRLTVLQLTEKRVNQSVVWLCRCDCGTELTVTTGELLSGHKKSCGCLKMTPKAEDITGMRSGTVIALERTEQQRRGCYLWRCKCDCGKELLVEPYKIRNGIIKSCGCQRHTKLIKDLTGMKFGKLTALERLDEKSGSSYVWRCKCDCGNETKVSANALLKGGTKSCGCGKIEAIKETIRKYGTIVDHEHFVDGTSIERIKSTYKLRSDNKSGYTGVYRRGNRYVAMITFKQKAYYLGSYEQIEDAVQARHQAEGMLFEPFLMRCSDT